MQARGGGDNKCGRTSDFGGEFLSRVTMECQFHLGLDRSSRGDVMFICNDFCFFGLFSFFCCS